MKKISGLACIVVCVTACAKHADEIPASYVSPLQYNSYNCQQIEMETASLSRRLSEIGGHVEREASSDDVEMGVGLVLLWPTLFFLDGDTPQATEYARLKGEFEALEKASIQKQCGIRFERPVIRKPEPVKEPASEYPSGRRR